MKPGILLVAVFVSIFVLLALNFGSCTPSEATLTASCDDFMKLQPNAVINKQIDIPVNGKLTIQLCSNATTGFKWSEIAQLSDSKIIQQASHVFTAPQSQAGATGAPGTETWVFKALKVGTVTISNEYSQPWQGGSKSVWKYMVKVTVK
jgi:inhibitor of cysteine peptidase